MDEKVFNKVLRESNVKSKTLADLLDALKRAIPQLEKMYKNAAHRQSIDADIYSEMLDKLSDVYELITYNFEN